MGTRKKASHMRFVTARHACACTHCGDVYVINLPCSLRVVGAIMKAYATDHRRCAATERGQRLAEELKREHVAAGSPPPSMRVGIGPGQAETLGDKVAAALIANEVVKHPPDGWTAEIVP